MITKKIGEEFPDIITVGNFGQTWENRDLKYIKLDARKDRNKDKPSSLSETDTSSSTQEKSSSMSDDDFIKSLGTDVHNVYVQLDQEVSTIKQSLKKNIELAQVGHIDSNLLKIKDEDDNVSTSDSSSGESKKKEEVKSISQMDLSEGSSQTMNLS